MSKSKPRIFSILVRNHVTFSILYLYSTYLYYRKVRIQNNFLHIFGAILPCWDILKSFLLMYWRSLENSIPIPIALTAVDCFPPPSMCTQWTSSPLHCGRVFVRRHFAQYLCFLHAVTSLWTRVCSPSLYSGPVFPPCRHFTVDACLFAVTLLWTCVFSMPSLHSGSVFFRRHFTQYLCFLHAVTSQWTCVCWPSL